MTDDSKRYLDEFTRTRKMTEEQAMNLKVVRGIVAGYEGEEFDWNDTGVVNGQKISSEEHEW